LKVQISELSLNKQGLGTNSRKESSKVSVFVLSFLIIDEKVNACKYFKGFHEDDVEDDV
jgi:hypothetical protein